MKKWWMYSICAAFFLTGCAEDRKIPVQTEEATTISIMHYWGETDADESAKCFRKIVDEEFSEAFPNVELVESVYDNATYKKKIKIMMASDEVPDIMFGYGGGFSEAFVDAGKVLPLDSYLSQEYKDKMDMNFQSDFIYDGQQYGICFSYWTGVLYCNQSLFDEAGVQIPQTYEDLLEVSQRLRENDIQPVACGMLDQWPGQQWINNFTMQLGGAELYKKLALGEESLDNDILAEAADLVQNLVKSDVFCDDMYKMTSSEAEELFLNGETAMIYIGSWYTSAAEERLGDKLAVAKMPILPGARYLEDYHGGGSNGWMVSGNTKNPGLAVEVAEWLSYRLSCHQPQSSTFHLEEGEQERSVSKIEQNVLNLYKNKKEGGCAWDTLMKPERVDIWLNLCGQLFNERFNGTGFTKLLKSQIEWRSNE